jgi:type I restriction enzyme S subunit
MPTYTCEKCARVFKQKSGFSYHIAKKNDCSKTVVIDAIVASKVEEKVKEVIRATQQKPEITKETLPAFFEDLHNLLWNKAGLNPERALEHMTFFFAYRLIEQQADMLSLPQECRWTFIASLKNENDLFETIKRGVSEFRKRPKTKAFFKPHEIQKADIVYEIVQQINRISLKILQETDTLGDIFEYMLGRGMSTMSDEGQYFTNRAICKLAFKLAHGIKKNLRRADGTLCTFADWFCGTGGFPAEFVKGVKGVLGDDVDWKKDSASVFCQDMNLSSVTTTLLNMLILTGIPFSGEKIRGSNSFTDPITSGAGAPFNGLTIDYCFMNPPYGGDKNKGKEYKFAYSKQVKGEDGKKTTRYFVNQEIQSIGIEDDDKVSAGVQLAMATLSADGGVCSIVLPQGFFANRSYTSLRKKISEEYKISFIVDIASGAFKNTGTKTSMMVFQKGVGPTEKVAFIGLDEKPLVEPTLDELRAKNYSFNYKQYLPQSAVEIEGFEMVKLGDIIELETGTYITKKTSEEGPYPVYGGGGISSYIAEHNRENKFVIAKDGVSEICARFVHGKFFLNHHGWTFHTTKENINYQYVGHWLLNNQSSIYALAVGTAQKGINQEAFLSLEIPLPSLERQQQIVEAIDGWAGLAQQEEVALKILEKQMMFQVKEMGRGQARVKLGEVCDIKCGKPMPKTDIVEGDVPVIGGGISPMGFHNVSTHEAYTPIISQRGTAGHISRYSTKAWITPNAVIPRRKDDSTIINDDMMFYILKNEQWSIDNIVEKTAQPLLTIGNLKDIEIRIPHVAEQQTLQSDFDEIRHKHAKIATYKAKAQEAIQRLIPGASPV